MVVGQLHLWAHHSWSFVKKPKKHNSIKPGLEAKSFGNTATHTLSPIQLVAGSDRRIHHGINLARDAIYQAGKSKAGCGLLDPDFMAGFDWLDMAWVYMVLEKKGVDHRVIDRV